MPGEPRPGRHQMDLALPPTRSSAGAAPARERRRHRAPADHAGRRPALRRDASLGRQRRVTRAALRAVNFRTWLADGVLVVPRPELDPLLGAELAAGAADLGALLEVLLPRRPGREQDQHRRRLAADVVEAVDAALGHVQEITRGRVDPLCAVKERDRAAQDVERLGERLVEVCIWAATARAHVPFEQAELLVSDIARCDEPYVGT